MNPRTPHLPIFLGCPVGACGQWGGQVYPARTPRSGWLPWYTQTFNTVEGNSTVYALPQPSAIKPWAEQTTEGFRFALKFPRIFSHDLQVENSQTATSEFLYRIEPLRTVGRLGSTFLKLGPRFGPDRFRVLARSLKRLPHDFLRAVELRHVVWFDGGDHEQRTHGLLQQLGTDKALFDSRSLFQSLPDDAVEQVAQERNPCTPVRQTVTGKHPMLRLVGRNRVELTDRYLDRWVPILAGWVRQGLQPFVLTHAPDDQFVLAFARRLTARMQSEMPRVIGLFHCRQRRRDSFPC